MSQNHDTVKNVLDVVAILGTVGAFLNMLTPLFGLIGAIVGVMRIYEMATGKDFYTLFRRKKADDAKQE
jgi:hypothetical protein